MFNVALFPPPRAAKNLSLPLQIYSASFQYVILDIFKSSKILRNHNQPPKYLSKSLETFLRIFSPAI